MSTELDKDQVVEMMQQRSGIYLCSDTKTPEATVPIASIGGVLHSMVLDEALDPEGFLETMTVSGPFTRETSVPNTLKSMIDFFEMQMEERLGDGDVTDNEIGDRQDDLDTLYRALEIMNEL